MNVMINDLARLNPGARRFLDKEKKLFIGGEWVVSASRATFAAIDPANGQTIAEVPRADAADVDRAVASARTALDNPDWRDMAPADRERLMHRFADLIEAHAEELGQIEALDVGMPAAVGQYVEVGNVLATLRYMAGWPTKITGRTMDIGEPMPDKRYFAFTRREPVGVVGAIVPWNVPLMIAMWKIAPALATGCAVVLKPSEVTPLASLRLAELAEDAGLPAGVLNVLTGYGNEAGAALVAHPGVDKISFTGSVATGKAINRAATDTMKRVTLELGGKSPVVVLDDADLDKAVPAISLGIFGNTGQVCVAGSRLYVQRKVMDETIERLAREAKGLKIGPGLHPESQIGPLVSAAQRDKVLGYIEAGLAAGGTAATGGRVIDGPGYYVEPTVLVNPPQSSSAVQEEIFGPVISAIPFDDAEEAAHLANDTIYGLAAFVWSRDIQKVHRLIPRLKAGTVYVNSTHFPHPAMPLGGYKQSGIGKDLGEEAIDHYTETKSVMVGLT